MHPEMKVYPLDGEAAELSKSSTYSRTFRARVIPHTPRQEHGGFLPQKFSLSWLC